MKKRTKIIFSVLVVAAVLAATYRVGTVLLQPVWKAVLRWKKSLRAADVWPVILPIRNCRFMPVCRLPENWSRKMLVWPTALST